MTPSLHLVRLSGTPILQQLQWEEALLRADKRNWCLLNRGTPPAIVVGISGQLEKLIHKEKWKEAPIPIIRRFSGGGTVVVNEETLFVTLICQSDALPIPPFPHPIMQWTADTLYAPLFPKKPFLLQENDYVFGEKKWGGNAQSIIKGRWLHHSSLLWDYKRAMMDYLLPPPKTPAYRKERTHTEFLCCLRDHHPCPNLFQDEVIKQLKSIFNIIEEREEELLKIASLPHRSGTRIEWL